MEALVLQQDLEPFPKRPNVMLVFKNEGLLSSTYKQETINNFFQSNPQSIFGIKQRVKSMQYQSTSYVVAVVKLAVFAIILAIALV